MFNVLLDLLMKYVSSSRYKQLKKNPSIGQKKEMTACIKQ